MIVAGPAYLPGRRFGKTHHARLVDERHELLLAVDGDAWWAPWRRLRRLRRLAAVEASLERTGYPW